MQKHVQKPLDSSMIPLDDPEFYLDDPYTICRRVRAEDPVFWHDRLKFWMLTKQEDVRFVGNSDLFTAGQGVVLDNIINGTSVDSLFPAGAENLSTLDPPRQQALRKMLAPMLSVKAMKRMEPRVRTRSRELLDKLPVDTAFDWMEKYAVPLPLILICELLGISNVRMHEFKEWSDIFIEAAGGSDEERTAHFDRCMDELWRFLGNEIEIQRKKPVGGIISYLPGAEIDGERLSTESILSMCVLLLVAGNETTRSGLTAMAHLLAQHPEQYERLVADPSLCASAVEETLRYFTISNGFFRIAREDVVLRGKLIRKGDPVYMFLPAANRDDEIFQDPDVFDVARPRGHAAFGLGFHHCAGNLVARLELRVSLEEMIKRFSRIELAGQPVRRRSTVNNSYNALPVRLSAHNGCQAGPGRATGRIHQTRRKS